MRRIDALGIGLLVFLAGGFFYLGLKLVGLDGQTAGIWSQVGLVTLLLIWAGSYLFRVAGGKMTYNQQLQDYEDAVLQKRLDEMSPEELEALQAKLEQAQPKPAQSQEEP
jgi:hypothetical protein